MREEQRDHNEARRPHRLTVVAYYYCLITSLILGAEQWLVGTYPHAFASAFTMAGMIVGQTPASPGRAARIRGILFWAMLLFAAMVMFGSHRALESAGK